MGRDRGHCGDEEKAEILTQFERRFGCRHLDLVDAYVTVQKALQEGGELRELVKDTPEAVKDTLAIFGYLAYSQQIREAIGGIDD